MKPTAAARSAALLRQLDARMTVEQQVRAMSKRQRVDHLKTHGWQRLGYRGSQTWIRPAESWRFFTLAAAIRNQLDCEATS
jgi:hypothetical protein